MGNHAARGEDAGGAGWSGMKRNGSGAEWNASGAKAEQRGGRADCAGAVGGRGNNLHKAGWNRSDRLQGGPDADRGIDARWEQTYRWT
jgi:hypothetical protein